MGVPVLLTLPAPEGVAQVPSPRQKVVEEAAESWMACEHESVDRAAEEISQLLYQVQALMLARGISIDDVYRKL